MGSRRRSLSASRTLESTVSLVGRIGASLRISGRQSKSKKAQFIDEPRSVTNSPQPSRLCLEGTLSCPATPETRRRKFVRDGATQLTSLSTLLTNHRHLFLFDDVLLISKQKGPNSYKFKQKVPLNKVWIFCNNCTHSFLIGWPNENFVAHFSSEQEKESWFTSLKLNIRRKLTPFSTTISVHVKVDGRQQIIRHEINNGTNATDILAQLVDKINLGPDPNTFELCVESEPGGSQPLNGIENVYAFVMDRVEKMGLNLSESVLQHLDTCPMVKCRLAIQLSSTPKSHQNVVSHVKKAILAKIESKKLFGKKLEGSMPPQPVLTMIDYLSMNALDIEGIFRKSPKASTVRELKNLLDNGQLPNFHDYSAHVTASLLKEYLRSIPGQLLLSGNYDLWIEALAESEKRSQLEKCRNLLQLLPPSHMILLRSVLRLLRRVSNNGNSKMNVKSLAVCIAPSLLENPVNAMDNSIKRVPELAEVLIENAPELFNAFEEDGPLLPNNQLSESTDSGLCCDAVVGSCKQRNSVSPDSALLDSPNSEEFTTDIDTIDTDTLDKSVEHLAYSHIAKRQFAFIDRRSPSLQSPRLEQSRRLNNNFSRPSLTYNLSSPLPQTYEYSHKKELSSDSTATLVSKNHSGAMTPDRKSSTASVHGPVIPSSPVMRARPGLVRSPVFNNDDIKSPSLSHRSLGNYNASPIRSPNLSYRESPNLNNNIIKSPCFNSNPSKSAYLSTKSVPSPISSHRPLFHSHSKPANAAAKPPLPLGKSPWRPPRRTAEEIMMENLEVNWSVPSIRSVFQKEDLKPAHIDTVYATADLIQRQK